MSARVGGSGQVKIRGVLGLTESPVRRFLKRSFQPVASSFSAATEIENLSISAPKTHAWKGNNRFFCRGRVMLGPSAAFFCAMFLLSTMLVSIFVGVM
jgi:hypothetical protein